MLIKAFNDIIKVGRNVIDENKGYFFPVIVKSKRHKEMEVSTCLIKNLKKWKWPERSNNIFYELDKIKEGITLQQLLNSRNNCSVL